MSARLKKILSIVLLTACFSATAESSDIFVARNIRVDVTERNSEIARRHAMSEAHAIAFRKILERVVAKGDLQYLPEFSPEEIAYILKEVSVVKESSSPVRYAATLNISFDEEKTKQVLTEMGISFVLSASKPYVLFPVYRDGGNTMIFEDNPWRRTWRRPPDSALIPLMQPKYDAQDRQLLTSANPTRDELIKLSDAYGTEGVIIAEAVKIDEEQFKLSFRKYANGILSERYEKTFAVENGNQTAALRKMADYIAAHGDEVWRARMAVNVSEPNLLVIVVPLRDLEQLNSVRERIEKIPLIAKYELKAVKQDRAQINVWHSSDIKDIERAFRKQKLGMIRIDDLVYGVQDLIPPRPKKEADIANPEETKTGE